MAVVHFKMKWILCWLMKQVTQLSLSSVLATKEEKFLITYEGVRGDCNRCAEKRLGILCALRKSVHCAHGHVNCQPGKPVGHLSHRTPK
jgi:hypothetical protein